MLINEFTTVHTPLVTLVPYTKNHVPAYHEWMQDPAIQAATASDPLTLQEEYAMQEKWRRDGDKLTFIVTKILEKVEVEAEQERPRDLYDGEHGTEEGQKTMAGEAIGDVNLFISLREADVANEPDALDEPHLNSNGHHGAQTSSSTSRDEELVGELELMIPHPLNQRKGFGRTAILAFLWYILMHETDIVAEVMRYKDSQGRRSQDPQGAKGRVRESNVAENEDRVTGERRGEGDGRRNRFDYFSVKIGRENERSIALFESLGFRKVGRGEVNWFGEFELRLHSLELGGGDGEGAGVAGMLERFGIGGVREGRFEG